MSEEFQYNEITKMPRQSSIDVLKCVASFLVVVIHFGPYWMSPISRVAVPLFFVITGYYFITISNSSKFWKHIRKVLIMTVGASLFYCLYSLISSIFSESLHHWVNMFNIKRIVVYLLFDLDLFGYHLWYFYAILYDLIIVYVAFKFGGIKYLNYFIPVLLVAFFVLQYNNFPNCYYRNFLFEGLPCFCIGILMRQNTKQIVAFLSNKLFYFSLFCCFLISFAGFYLHNIIWGGEINREMFIYTMPLVLALFCWAVKFPYIGDNTIFAMIGRRYSAYIYIFHVLIGSLFEQWSIFPSDSYLLIKSIVIFVTALLFSIVYDNTKQYILRVRNI